MKKGLTVQIKHKKTYLIKLKYINKTNFEGSWAMNMTAYKN